MSDELEQIREGRQGAHPAGAEEGPGGAPAPEEGPGAAPAPELERLTRERDDYLDALRRLKAEFDNYRKRVERDRVELSARAAERLVKQLLPLLDDLERALDAAGEHGEHTLAEGVALVHRGLESVLAREGLVEVPTSGAFDPHTQEALLSQPSEEPEGTVIQVLQKGYTLGERVVRPARVVVSAGLPATHGRGPAPGERE